MKVKINNEEYDLFTKAITKKDINLVKAKDLIRDKNGLIDFSKYIELHNKKLK